MLLIKKFIKDKAKLKGFFMQIKMQIDNKGLRLPTFIKKIAYTGINLTGKLLKWFQPYLAETQVNKITSTNNEVRYMFLIWEGFYN